MTEDDYGVWAETMHDPDGWHLEADDFIPAPDAPAYHADAPFTVEPPPWVGLPIMVPFADFDLYLGE